MVFTVTILDCPTESSFPSFPLVQSTNSDFPFMVPMWTLPIAIACGNTLVLKPSEKVPLTMAFTMSLLKEAGLPNGVVNLVNGTAEGKLS